MQPMDAFSLNRLVLKISGLWFPNFKFRFCQVLYAIFAVLNVVFLTVFTFTEFISLFYTYKHPDDCIKNVNFLLTHLVGLIKIGFWFNFEKIWRSLMTTLNSRVKFPYEDVSEFKFEQVWTKYNKISVTIVVLLLTLSNLTVLSSFIPLFIKAIQVLKENRKQKIELKLPYFSWIPFSMDTPEKYSVALIIQFVPIYSFAWSIIAVDVLYINMCNIISANFVILQGAFATIKQRVEARSEQKRFRKNQLRRMMNIEIKRNYQHLQTIIGACDDLERNFNFMTLSQGCATLFIFCTSLYLVWTAPMGPKLIAEVIYSLAMFFQLFLYCRFGNEVTLTGLDISNSIFHADWLDTDISFKKSMAFTIQKMNKPIYMTMGRFAPLTLNTFVQVAKTSYSLFALLRNTSE